MNRLSADLTLLTIAVIWGLAFVFQKAAMAHVGPITFLAARSVVAALTLALLATRDWDHAKPPPRDFWMTSIAGGLAFFAGAALQQMGIVTATVTNAGFLTGLYVVITPLMVWAVAGTPPQAHLWLAVALAFVGTWLLGGGTLGGFSYGDGLVAASAMFWAAHILIIAQSVKYARPITFTATQFVVVAILGTTGALLFEPVSIAGLQAAIPQIAFVGVLSSALTFTLLAIAMRHTPAVEATILISLETVFAAMAGMLLMGETLAPIGWLGAALMFTATLLVQVGPAVFPARRSGG